MHPNAELITRFYTAFAARDAATMGTCYAPHAIFSDPAFGTLEGPSVAAMWTMLCARASDLTIAFGDVSADASAGKAHWEAHYTFSRTGRRVHNVIDASFVFRDGLIVQHTDVFDFWAWSRQALGPIGWGLGWNSAFRERIRRTARRGLDQWIQRDTLGTAGRAAV